MTTYHHEVRGVVILATDGDRTEFYQNPNTYKPGPAELTAFGAFQAHQLGSFLREEYLHKHAESFINGINGSLVDSNHIYVRAKAGGEGNVVYGSTLALLQGLFPPTTLNKFELANETTVVAPLGGYQYVPIETVEPKNERSLESWTDCPAFASHVEATYKHQQAEKYKKTLATFFDRIRDYAGGRELSYENMWNLYDYVSIELIHNRSYAHRLPPTLVQQARAAVDVQQGYVFSAKHPGDIGNIAGRTVLPSILGALERIAFDHDPLKLFIQGVTYQPLISLLHMTEVVNAHPELHGLPNYASALAIELRRGHHDDRDFLRFKVKNGTADDDFQTVNVFGHHGDIPLTEFIYRIQNFQISNNKEWHAACNPRLYSYGAAGDVSPSAAGLIAFLFFTFTFLLARVVRRRRAAVRLTGTEPVLKF